MTTSHWTDADTKKALAIWQKYQKEHDVSNRKGQAVGIDPGSGRIWFGESATDIWQQMDREGISAPIYCLRVGSNHYGRKGGIR